MNGVVKRFLPAFLLAVLIAVAASARPWRQADPRSQETHVLEPGQEPDLKEASLPAPDEARSILADGESDPDGRLKAVPVLAERGTEEDWSLLKTIVLDRNADTSLRARIIISLGRSGNPRALGPLSEIYHKEPGFTMRPILIGAIGELQEDVPLPDAREILVEALRKDPSDSVRTLAARALESPPPGDSERTALKDAVLSDSCENVKLAALQVLIRLGDEEAFLRTVSELADTPHRVRSLAGNGLGE